jgi:hypothetical protein
MGDLPETMPDPAFVVGPPHAPAPEEHIVDIHKPKPVHNWREFLIEIGTIICGILIALSLEQVVSTLDWNRKVSEARSTVGVELAENLGRMQVRLQLEQCLDQRLDAIAALVDRAAKTGTLPPLPNLRSPPYTTWGNGVWSTAVSAQIASHFPTDELHRYGRFYSLLGVIAAAEPQEETVWTTLFELVGPGRAFNSDDARTYRRAVGEARELNGLISGFSVRGLQVVESHHIQFDRKVYDDRAVSVKNLLVDCGMPTGVPPPVYGAAPATGFSRVARAHMSPSDK